jgi:hypothetical protein
MRFSRRGYRIYKCGALVELTSWLLHSNGGKGPLGCKHPQVLLAFPNTNATSMLFSLYHKDDKMRRCIEALAKITWNRNKHCYYVYIVKSTNTHGKWVGRVKCTTYEQVANQLQLVLQKTEFFTYKHIR